MEVISTACAVLKIPRHHTRALSADRFVCLVSEDWFSNIILNGHPVLDTNHDLHHVQAELYLAPSCENLPKPWHRLSVKCVRKNEELVERLREGTLYNATHAQHIIEHLSLIARENFRTSWQDAFHGYTSQSSESLSTNRFAQFTDVFKQYVMRCSPWMYVFLDSASESQPESYHSSTSDTHVEYNSNNVEPILAFLENQDWFFLIQPYYAYTLKDLLSYSPAILNTSHAKPLFIIFQLLKAIENLHTSSLPTGELKLHNVLVDKKLWINISVPNLKIFTCQTESVACDETLQEQVKPHLPKNRTVSDPIMTDLRQFPNRDVIGKAKQFLQSYQYATFSLEDLPKLVDDWVNRRLSNFEYLMVLNHLAGRRMGDPNHHPVIPWIMDFSVPGGGYRDLTLSKYRINKGDNQLDLTYESPPVTSDTLSSHIPHHVSDVLSDITYYVYTARRTPKSILCAHVRSKWVPNEYPTTMRRMQEWTPDECIPEFFIDSTIFKSIHDDLPDLEVPSWCLSPEDFIQKHISALESEKVSESLNHWIDLTFGYKLSGSAAIKSKNVHLQLMDKHRHVTNRGVIQLFTHPHPHRLTSSKALSVHPPRIARNFLLSQANNIGLPSTPNQAELFGTQTGLPSVKENLEDAAIGDGKRSVTSASKEGRPEFALIRLPKDFEPLASLEQLEAHYGFSSRTMNKIAISPKQSKKSTHPSNPKVALINKDMTVFGCLVCEMFLLSKIRMEKPDISLEERVCRIKDLWRTEKFDLPKMIIDVVNLTLNLDEKKSALPSTITDSGLPLITPTLLLQTFIDIIPFPNYFYSLYDCIQQLKQKDEHIERIHWSLKTVTEKQKLQKVFAREKVSIIEKYLSHNYGNITSEGLELLLPYVQELFQNVETVVQATWSLFNLVARELGYKETVCIFLKYLSVLFSGVNSSPKHIKLYHRTFLTQLLLGLGLKTFLTHFSTLLVEAVAGYKDFPVGQQLTKESEQLDSVAEEDDSVFDAPDVMIDEDVSNIFEQTDEFADHKSDSQHSETEDFLQSQEHDVDDVSNCLLAENLQSCTIDDVNSIDSISLDQRSDNYCSSDDELSLKEDSEELQFEEQLVIENEQKLLNRKSHHVENGNGEQDDLSTAFSHTEGNTFSYKIPSSVVADAYDKCDRPVNIFESEVPNEPDESADDFSNDSNRKTASRDTALVSDVMDIVDDTVTPALNGEIEDDENDNANVKNDAPSTSSEHMVRSETDEFSFLSQANPSEVTNIRDVASESIKWLSGKLGPFLTSKYLARNLIRMLGLCYLGDEQLIVFKSQDESCLKTTRCISGDRNARKVLECLRFICLLYGEQVVLLHYIQCIVDLIHVAKKRLTQRAEAGLLSSMVLLRYIIPFISDKSLLDILQDVISREALLPVIKLISSSNHSFPGGSHIRSVVCYKIIDVLYVIGLRIGFEMTRKYLTGVMQTFFASFNQVYAVSRSGDNSRRNSDSITFDQSSIEDAYLNIKIDDTTLEYIYGTPVEVSKLASPPSPARHSLMLPVDDLYDKVDDNTGGKEKISEELCNIFTPELALAAYIPFCRVFGSLHLEQHLKNEDLIRQLCIRQERYYKEKLSSSAQKYPEYSGDDLSEGNEIGSINAISSNVEIIGNRIVLQDDKSVQSNPDFSTFGLNYTKSPIASIDPELLKCQEMEVNKKRHLRGNWLAYWEHELGLSERDTLFNFKQIKLQSFQGHSNSVRSIFVLDNENSFLSGSKDKTVKVWSIQSSGDGSAKCPCQWTYPYHKKSVMSVAYVDSMRLAATCDSTVHIWDPFVGEVVRQLEAPRYSPVIALSPLPQPSTLVVTATNESSLRFLDLRMSKYAHEYKCSTTSSGVIRAIAVSPESNWIAVGFSSGIISLLDLQSGILMGTWKGHEGDIAQLKAYNKSTFVSSSFDQTMKVWNVDDGREVSILKDHSDPVHCINFYRSQMITATTGNRIGVHSAVDERASFTSTKLMSDTFKGVLTTMAVLPLNRTLLLGADNGSIRLLC